MHIAKLFIPTVVTLSVLLTGCSPLEGNETVVTEKEKGSLEEVRDSFAENTYEVNEEPYEMSEEYKKALQKAPSITQEDAYNYYQENEAPILKELGNKKISIKDNLMDPNDAAIYFGNVLFDLHTDNLKGKHLYHYLEGKIHSALLAELDYNGQYLQEHFTLIEGSEIGYFASDPAVVEFKISEIIQGHLDYRTTFFVKYVLDNEREIFFEVTMGKNIDTDAYEYISHTKSWGYKTN